MTGAHRIGECIRFAALLVALLVLTAPGYAAAGFGVSPPLIEEGKLVRGITMERIVYLVQGVPERDVPIEVDVNSEIEDWVTFPQGMPITIPKGVQQFPLVVRIEVPEDAEFGKYGGEIRITAVPQRADEGGEVAIALGGLVTLDLTVGEGVISEFSLKQIKILDIKEGEDPRAEVEIINSGNVLAGPDSVTFELFNKFGEIRLAYAESHDFEKIPAFTENGSIVEFPMDIYVAPGEYWGHVKVYEDQKLIGDLRTVFNVREKSLFEKIMPYAIGGAALLVLAALFFIVRPLMRRRRPLPPAPPSFS
jgi:hypothetical protein